MSNSERLKLLKEITRRNNLERYEDNFEEFAKECLKILPKSVKAGFLPLIFNDPQRLINEKIEEQRKETGKVRAIILKARQQGISTYCAGRVFWKTYFTPHSKSVVMAHDSATSDALFNMSKNLIKNMPEDYRPPERKSNAKEIIFDHNDAGYRLYTAGSPEAGRGTTPTIAHLSEVAFWTYDEKILAGLFQGIPGDDGTEVILESTANGAQGEFYRLWQQAIRGEGEYIPIFIPWYMTKEYRRTTPERFILTREEEQLKEEYGLDNEQLNWRRIKISESGSIKFQQEYPIKAEEAFVVSGSNVFPVDKLDSLITKEPEIVKEYNPITGFFDDHSEGSLSLWEYPSHRDNFVIGADVALGVRQDYSTAVVLNTDNKVVALYRDNAIDPSKFGELLFYLGRYFNNAFLAVESNSMGVATLQQLQSMDYVNLYKQTKIANVSNEEGERLGFRTTQATKPAIIGNLKSAITDEDLNIESEIIIHEMRNYIALESGKTEAAPGNFDDTVMALAIALEVLRTHRDRLASNRISFKNRASIIPTEDWI